MSRPTSSLSVLLACLPLACGSSSPRPSPPPLPEPAAPTILLEGERRDLAPLREDQATAQAALVPQQLTGPLRALATSPRHDLVAVLAESGMVAIWDAERGGVRAAQLHYPRLDRGDVTLRFDATGTRVVVATARMRQGRGISVWDLHHDRWSSRDVSPRFSPELVALHGDGLVVVDWTGETPSRPALVRLGWDLAVVSETVLAEVPRAISVSARAEHVAWLGANGTSVHGERGEVRFHRAGRHSDLGFRPGGTLLAAVTETGALQLLHPDSGAVLHEVALGANRVRWSPDGEWLVGESTDRWGPVVDGTTGAVLDSEQRAHRGPIALGAGTVWAPDGSGAVERWSPGEGVTRVSLDEPALGPIAVGRSALVAGLPSGAGLVGRVGSGPRRTVALVGGPSRVGGVDWGPGRRLLTVDEAGATLFEPTRPVRIDCPMDRIFAYDLSWGDGGPVLLRGRTACRAGHEPVPDTIAVSADGSTLVVVREGRIEVLREGAATVALRLDRGESVACGARGCGVTVDVSRDGSTLLVTREGKPPRAFDARTGRGRALALPSGAEAVFAQLAPDGRTAVFGGRSTLHLVELRRGRSMWSAPVQRPNRAYSPDGASWLVSSPNGPIVVLDAHAGRVRTQIDRPAGFFGTIVFTPDGARVVATAHGDRLRVEWDARSGAELGRVERGDARGREMWPLDGDPIACRSGRATRQPVGGSATDLGPCDEDHAATAIRDGWLAVALGDRVHVVRIDEPSREAWLRLHPVELVVGYASGRVLGTPSDISAERFQWRASGAIVSAPLVAPAEAPSAPLSVLPWTAAATVAPTRALPVHARMARGRVVGR